MVLSTNLVERVKTMFFGAMFDQLIVSQFKVLYFEQKFNRRTILCVIKLQTSSQLYQFSTF